MRIRQAMGGRTAAILAAVSIVAGSTAFILGSASANVPNSLFELDIAQTSRARKNSVG